MTEWTEIITDPSVNLILGFRGMGKTVLAYYLVEMIAKKFNKWKIVFGVPETIRDLLPDDYHIENDPEKLTINSVIIIDEISLFAYARKSMSKANEIFDRITANSRKNNQIIFYITHHSRKVDINLVTDIDNLIYKKPSKLQIEMDRPSIRKFARRAYEYLKDKDKTYSYVFSFVADKEIGIINPLPKFWTEDLSSLISIRGVETKEKPKYELLDEANKFPSHSKEFKKYMDLFFEG